MPRNGNGVYSLPASSWNPAVTDTTIESSAANTTLSDLAAALTQSVSKDGQTTMTGNLPMGNNKLTGLANGAVATDSIAYGQAAKLAGGNTFTGNQIINGSVSLSGSLTVTGAIIFTGSMTVENLNVTSVASLNVLNVAGVASVNLLTVSSVASVNVLNVSSTASVGGAITSQGVQVIPIGIPALRQGLVGSISGANTNFIAPYLLLIDDSGNPKIVTNVNVTANIASSGANGLDAGSPAAATWYYFWIINNGTATTAGTTASLISASATAPTMPSGYTYKALVSARQTRSGAGDFVSVAFHQVDNRIWSGLAASESTYQVLAATGPTVPNTFQTLSISSAVPPVAKTAFGIMGSTDTTAQTAIAVQGSGSIAAGLCLHNSDGATTTILPAAYGFAGGSTWEVPLITAQTIEWTGGAAGATYGIGVTGFTI